MSRIVTVLGAQVRPVPLDPKATLEKFEAEVEMAGRAFPQADLYVFPELYLMGDDPFNTAGAADFAARSAVSLSGPLIERVGKIAARAKRWICAGSIFERAEEQIYNTAIVLDPEGRLAASYRKLFVWQPFEAQTPGNELCPVIDIAGGKVGVMICYDGWFPEVARGLALRGVELVLQPTLTTTPDREQELVLARANAIVNQCYVININAVPRMGGGRSIGVDPEGHVLFQLGQTEELVVEVVDLDRVTAIRERGTRGMNRVLHHVQNAPSAVFEPYRSLLTRREAKSG